MSFSHSLSHSLVSQSVRNSVGQSVSQSVSQSIIPSLLAEEIRFSGQNEEIRFSGHNYLHLCEFVNKQTIGTVTCLKPNNFHKVKKILRASLIFSSLGVVSFKEEI